MKKMKTIEYGVASNFQYILTLNGLKSSEGVEVLPSNLHVTLYVKATSNITEIPIFSVTGVYNDVDKGFDFSITQEQANLLTIGVWYFGFETRLGDINGKVVKRSSYSRKVLLTVAKQ